jgi:pyridoxal phosphate enzyme (YggS family)
MAALNSDFEESFDPERLAKNLGMVRQQIAQACQKAGRESTDVTLVAVTKTVGVQTCNELIRLGYSDLAENRPQVLWEKSTKVDPSVRWHMIGHLQRNKSPRTIPLLWMMHAMDSERLGEQMAKDVVLSSEVLSSEVPPNRLRILLELNLTEDSTKTGLSPEEAQGVLRKYVSAPLWQERLDLCGLMGMSSLQGDVDQTHREFERLRQLRDRWQLETGVCLPVLSMGMSDDFQIAIEHGSTMVRIGSLLYR